MQHSELRTTALLAENEDMSEFEISHALPSSFPDVIDVCLADERGNDVEILRAAHNVRLTMDDRDFQVSDGYGMITKSGSTKTDGTSAFKYSQDEEFGNLSSSRTLDVEPVLAGDVHMDAPYDESEDAQSDTSTVSSATIQADEEFRGPPSSLDSPATIQALEETSDPLGPENQLRTEMLARENVTPEDAADATVMDKTRSEEIVVNEDAADEDLTSELHAWDEHGEYKHIFQLVFTLRVRLSSKHLIGGLYSRHGVVCVDGANFAIVQEWFEHGDDDASRADSFASDESINGYMSNPDAELHDFVAGSDEMEVADQAVIEFWLTDIVLQNIDAAESKSDDPETNSSHWGLDNDLLDLETDSETLVPDEGPISDLFHEV